MRRRGRESKRLRGGKKREREKRKGTCTCTCTPILLTITDTNDWSPPANTLFTTNPCSARGTRSTGVPKSIKSPSSCRLVEGNQPPWTGTGVFWLVVVEAPSWPFAPKPKLKSLPVLSISARVWHLEEGNRKVICRPWW